MTIKNIIFDLGGVIIDIDYHNTLNAFRRLGAHNIDHVYTQSKQDSLFDQFDIGAISAADFRKALTAKLALDISDNDFDDAWNAMLGSLPIARLDFIKEKRQTYRTFLFSNTNEIHLPKAFEICQRENKFSTFEGYFEKEYYSHQFGQRKPNPEAFLAILEENNLKADETLFVDDSYQHIEGAKKAGLHTFYVKPGESTIFDIDDFLKAMELERDNSPRARLSLS